MQAMDQKLPEPQTIPLELGGKWIAWSSDCLRIVAHGDTLGEVKDEAKRAGEEDPCFQKAPRQTFASSVSLDEIQLPSAASQSDPGRS